MPQSRKSLTQRLRQLTPYVYFLPLAVVYVSFVIYPLLKAVWESFYASSILTGTRTFVGMANYVRVFAEDLVFRYALRNNLIYLAGLLCIGVPLAVGVASILNSERVRAKKLFTTIYMLPYILPLVGIGILFKMVFSFDFGIIAQMFRALGLKSLVGPWLAKFPDAIFVVLFVTIWSYFGGDALFLFASMQQIPQEILDSAKIDGARGWRLLRRITLPMIREMITVVIGSNTIGAFTQFGLFYLMLTKGPQSELRVLSTWIVSQAFDYDQMGYGSALTVVLLLVVMLVTFSYLALRKRANVDQ